MKMCTLVVYHGPSSFPRIMSLKVVFQICFCSIKMMGKRGVLVPRRGQLSYSICVSMRDSCIQQYRTIKSFIPQSSHIMILNSTKFGGNRTKDVEVGVDRRTDGQTNSYILTKLCIINWFICHENFQEWWSHFVRQYIIQFCLWPYTVIHILFRSDQLMIKPSNDWFMCYFGWIRSGKYHQMFNSCTV
jgi:hypothetical protein